MACFFLERCRGGGGALTFATRSRICILSYRALNLKCIVCYRKGGVFGIETSISYPGRSSKRRAWVRVTETFGHRVLTYRSLSSAEKRKIVFTHSCTYNPSSFAFAYVNYNNI